MIAALIDSDHRAAREVFATVGNAPQPSWSERTEGLRSLAALWDAHSAMVDRTILPGLPPSDRLAAVGEGNRRFAALAAELGRRAAEYDTDAEVTGQGWLTDFEALKRLFNAQCDREEAVLLPLLRDAVPPARLAEMTHRARTMRWPDSDGASR